VHALRGPAGAFARKVTVLPNKETQNQSNNLILIFEMGFLVDF